MVQVTLLIVAAALAMTATQLSPRMASLVEAVRPVLPYPQSTPEGDLPIDNSADSQWFVVWPEGADASRIIVRGNPLHPEVQQASVAAMEDINAAVAAAERRAQASYDRALERLRKTGKAGELETVTLEDEGVAGERIDAELEVTIELADANGFDIASGEPPIVQQGMNGPSWIVSVPANTYRLVSGDDRREHFRATETRLFFGVTTRPVVTRQGDEPRYRVAVGDVSPEAFSVMVRGNAALVAAIASGADWARLSPR